MKIVAPAGNMERFYSAISATADEIYLGLKGFGARRNAENFTVEELKKIILQPGELSEFYTFKSENQYKFTEISLRAKNLSDSPCSLFDATIIKAVIDGSENIYIDPVWIELVFDKHQEWKEPYEMLGISPPKTEKEKIEGV